MNRKNMKLYEFTPNETGFNSFFVMSESIEEAIESLVLIVSRRYNLIILGCIVFFYVKIFAYVNFFAYLCIEQLKQYNYGKRIIR